MPIALLLSALCRVTDPPVAPDPDPVGGTKKVYGIFKVQLSPQDKRTTFIGQLFTGTTPTPTQWITVMSSGEFKLFKPKTFFCEGCQGVCVAENTCEPYPDTISAGTVTFTGLKLKDSSTTFSLEPNVANYQMGAIKLAYPPCTEGAAITLTAAGNQTAAPFSLTAKGIDPLVVLSDSVPMIDGQPIEVQWVPAKIAGNSTIFVSIDISYHGGTKAKIEGECVDDGSFTIPAAMCDSLKSFGISGYPRLEISRIATGSNAATGAELNIISLVTLWLKIPGIISCAQTVQCPEGQYCAKDQRCRPVE
jgi:hypothetical protein